MRTAIEIEVFGSLSPGTKAQIICYTEGIEKKHNAFISHYFQLDSTEVNEILDCFKYAISDTFSTRYFLKPSLT